MAFDLHTWDEFPSEFSAHHGKSRSEIRESDQVWRSYLPILTLCFFSTCFSGLWYDVVGGLINSDNVEFLVNKKEVGKVALNVIEHITPRHHLVHVQYT